MKRLRLLVFAAAVGVVAVPAGAADLPVTYLVQEQPLKTAVAGTSQSFDLYSDAACAALVHTQLVPVEQVDVLSRLKLLTPRGAAKAPRTTELRHTLSGVPAAEASYLRVSGVGIARTSRARRRPRELQDHWDGRVRQEQRGRKDHRVVRVLKD
jgi:hypothetical protein